MSVTSSSWTAKLPGGLFSPRLREWNQDAWALAAAGRVVAVAVYLVGYIVLVLSHADDFTFRGFFQALFAKNFLVASPLTLIAVAAIGLHRDRADAATSRGSRLIDVAIIGAIVLAVLCVVGSIIGFVANLQELGDDFGFGFADLMIDIAAFIAAVTAGVWALLEADHRRGTAV
jgi:hypothetical protein